jgi:hypothetical protein
VIGDSTLRVARKWIDRCKEKISEVIYDMAELNYSTVTMFLKAPLPEGLNSIAEMEYRRQILVKAITPLIQDIVDAHVRNVRESWKLGLENQWVKLSRRKIITTNNSLADEYNNLAQKSLELYTSSLESYIKIIDQGITSPDGLDVISLSDQMANLNNFSKLFAKAAVEIYIKTLQKAHEENINDPSVGETKEKMLKTLFEISQTCNSIAEVAKINRKKYEKLFKETNRVDYEEAYFTFEDNYFSFKENTKELLEMGYQVSRDMNISNQWSPKIILALVQINPEKYGSLLNLQPKLEQLVTNTSWRASDSLAENWIKPDFNLIGWDYAQYRYNKENISVRGNLIPIWFSQVDAAGSRKDSTRFNIQDQGDLARRADSVFQKIFSKHIYLRKTFSIEGLPVSGDIKLILDDSFNLFLNGEYIATFTTEDSIWSKEHFHQLGDYLVDGENVIAIEAMDNNATGGGAIAVVNVKYLPGWDDKKQQIQLETSDERIKQNLVMDKYIIMH